MTQAQIAVTLQDIMKAKETLRGIKSEMKDSEKIESDEYKQLKDALKNLKAQVKAVEETFAADLAKEEQYQKLREMKTTREEELAQLNAQLFIQLAEMPKKAFDMHIDSVQGELFIQVATDLKIFVNGKEEKKRA